jgi:hypothetical protein
MPDDAQRRLRTGFVLAVLALAVFAVWTAGDFRTAARLFPEYMGYLTILLCLLELGRQFLLRNLLSPDTPSTTDVGLEAEEQTSTGMARALGILGWLLGYGGLILSLGAELATALFVPELLHLRFRSEWRATIGIVVGLLVLM